MTASALTTAAISAPSPSNVGGGGATMEIVANVEGIKGNVILWETNIYDKPETEDTISRIYHRIVDMINKEQP